MNTTTEGRGIRGGKFAGLAKPVASTEATDELRPPVREEDPRARARQRADELRGHLGDVVDGTDDFYIPEDVIPDGWTYESTHDVWS